MTTALTTTERIRQELFNALAVLIAAAPTNTYITPADTLSANDHLTKLPLYSVKELATVHFFLKRFYHPLKASDINWYKLTVPTWRTFEVVSNNLGHFDFNFDQFIMNTLKEQPFSKIFNEQKRVWEVWDFSETEIEDFCCAHDFDIINPEKLQGATAPASRKPLACFQIPIDKPSVMIVTWPYNKRMTETFKEMVPEHCRSSYRSPVFHWLVRYTQLSNFPTLMRWFQLNKIVPYGIDAINLEKEVSQPSKPTTTSTYTTTSTTSQERKSQPLKTEKPPSKRDQKQKENIDNFDSSFDFAIEG